MKYLGIYTFFLGFFFWNGVSLLNYNNFNIINIYQVYFILVLFCILTFFSYLFFIKDFKNQIKYSTYSIQPRTVFYVILVFLLLMVFNQFLNFGLIRVHTYTALSALFVFSFFCFMYSQKFSRLIFLCICIVIFIFLIDAYSRRYLLESTLAILYLFLIQNKKLTFKLFTQLFILCLLFLIFYFYLSGLRSLGFDFSIFENVSGGVIQTFSAMGFDTIYLTDFVLNYYSAENFLYGESFFAGFINFIPRFIWESKPIAFSIILSSDYYNLNFENIFTNFGPGLVAESYANGGYFATIIIAIILGSVLAKFDNYLLKYQNRATPIILGLIFYPALIFLIRGDFVNGFYDIYSRILVVLVLLKLTSLSKPLND